LLEPRQVRVASVQSGRQVVAMRGGVPEFSPPKREAGLRTVPMPDVVGSAVSAHPPRYGPRPPGLVLPNTLGHPLRRNKHRQGRMHLVKPNTANPYYPELSGLLLKSLGPRSVLAERLAPTAATPGPWPTPAAVPPPCRHHSASPRGRLHKGLRGHDWDVEDRLTAVSLRSSVMWMCSWPRVPASSCRDVPAMVISATACPTRVTSGATGAFCGFMVIRCSAM